MQMVTKRTRFKKKKTRPMMSSHLVSKGTDSVCQWYSLRQGYLDKRTGSENIGHSTSCLTLSQYTEAGVRFRKLEHTMVIVNQFHCMQAIRSLMLTWPLAAFAFRTRSLRLAGRLFIDPRSISSGSRAACWLSQDGQAGVLGVGFTGVLGPTPSSLLGDS